MKVLFIHHSTGANLIQEGNLRDRLKSENTKIELWDHSYNLYKYFSKLLGKLTYHTGLSDNRGRLTGRDFNIYLSNNSPKEYCVIFSREPNDHILRSILDYDVILFKNCYPTSKIESDDQLQSYKRYYEEIRNNIGRFKNKKFILLPFPPLRKELTTFDNANRAKQLNIWINSNDFLKGNENLKVFDLFGILSNDNGFLKREYRRFIPLDSHPNKRANIAIAKLLVDYLCSIV